MSWPEYVDFLMKKPGMVVGAIVSNTDGKIWANKGDFAFKTHKEVVKNLKGEEQAFEVDEWALLNDLFKTGKTDPIKGFWMNHKKYVLLGFEENHAYFKCRNGGACIAKTEKTFVVGIYATKDEDKNSWAGGNCNSVVEELASMLITSKF